MMEQQRLNVLFLPKWYPNRDKDQDGIFIKRHAAAVAPFANVRVLFATVSEQPQRSLVEHEQTVEEGIPTLRYFYRKSISGIGAVDKPLKLLLYFYCLFSGYRRLRKQYGRPDLIHVHVLLRTGIFAWFQKMVSKTPYLITEHWTIYLPTRVQQFGRLRKLLTRPVVREAAFVCPVSEDLQRAMQWHGFEGNYRVVPNVVKTELFRPLHLQEPGPKKQIIHISEFNERAKNISGILRAVKQLSQQRQDFELKLVGYGQAEAELHRLAEELGLKDTFVHFTGKLYGEELARLLAQSRFFVLFSNFENLPCVIIEALACGVPVLATRVGGVPEMVKPEFGILTEPGDEAALAAAMNHLLDHAPDYDKQALREFALKHYSYEGVGLQFAQLYHESVEAAPAAPDYA